MIHCMTLHDVLQNMVLAGNIFFSHNPHVFPAAFSPSLLCVLVVCVVNLAR